MSILTVECAANFEEFITANNQPVLIVFGATWCRPCKQTEALFEEMLRDEWQDKLSIFKIDVDQNPELAMKYQVMGVPTTLLLVDGHIKNRINGNHSRNRYSELISSYLEE